jgi:hypothetical protein
MTLAELLAARGVQRALVVDDACDEVPRSVDLTATAGDWATFAADLTPEHRDLLDQASPDTVDLTFDQKVADDRYVAAAWSIRDQLDGLADPIFEGYEAQRAADLDYVELARAQLTALGLNTGTCGREFEDRAQAVDLVVIDLYFGGGQNEAAFQESRRRLTDAVRRRRDRPPLVLLMSRSERIFERRDEFRDTVGLVDSGFRILMKPDLNVAGRLDRQLERLAENLPDTLKLAGFFNALEGGIDEAASRTLQVMRRLKLSDVGQIQQLLLEVEGEPVGSYLVDIFDRVLQHEIERNGAIIDAALAINDLTSSKHPPPYVTGSPQLQDVVERTLTQNRERLRLPGSADASVGFGDVLRPGAAVGAAGASGAALEADEALVVPTPVCDLQRGVAPRVLLASGKIKDIGSLQWSYAQDARTPAIQIDGELRSIKWNLKDIRTLTWGELDQAFQAGTVRVAARLREAHALEIQQKMLAGLGRVGLVAPMPATFPMSLEVFVLGQGRAPAPLQFAALADEAVIWVGRDDNGAAIRRLVATEHLCDGLDDCLTGVDEATIFGGARPAFNHIRASGELRRLLAAGLDVTALQAGAWLKVPAPTGGQQVPDMALVTLNDLPEVPRKLHVKAGVLLVVRELHREPGTPSLDDFAPLPGPADGEGPADG